MRSHVCSTSVFFFEPVPSHSARSHSTCHAPTSRPPPTLLWLPTDITNRAAASKRPAKRPRTQQVFRETACARSGGHPVRRAALCRRRARAALPVTVETAGRETCRPATNLAAQPRRRRCRGLRGSSSRDTSDDVRRQPARPPIIQPAPARQMDAAIWQ